MLIFSLRMVDRAVLGNTFSAYVIRAGRVLKQVFLVLAGLAFFTTDEHLKGIPTPSQCFFMVAFRMFDPAYFEMV